MAHGCMQICIAALDSILAIRRKNRPADELTERPADRPVDELVDKPVEGCVLLHICITKWT